LKKYAAQLSIELQPSRIAAAALNLLALGAIVFPVSLDLSYAAKILCITFVFVVWMRALTGMGWLSGWSLPVFVRSDRVHAIRYLGSNKWLLHTREHTDQIAQLLPGSFVHLQLVVLQFKTEQNQRFNVVILPDSLPVEPFRRLRVILKTLAFQVAES